MNLQNLPDHSLWYFARQNNQNTTIVMDTQMTTLADDQETVAVIDNQMADLSLKNANIVDVSSVPGYEDSDNLNLGDSKSNNIPNYEDPSKISFSDLSVIELSRLQRFLEVFVEEWLAGVLSYVSVRPQAAMDATRNGIWTWSFRVALDGAFNQQQVMPREPLDKELDVLAKDIMEELLQLVIGALRRELPMPEDQSQTDTGTLDEYWSEFARWAVEMALKRDHLETCAGPLYNQPHQPLQAAFTQDSSETFDDSGSFDSVRDFLKQQERMQKREQRHQRRLAEDEEMLDA